MIKKLVSLPILLCGLGLVWLSFGLFVDRTRADTGGTAFLPLIFAILDYDILLDEATLNPHVLTVKTGKTVTWKNGEDTPQTIISGQGVFTPTVLPPDGLFSWDATNAGIYTYTITGTVSSEGALVVSENGTADWFKGRAVTEAYQDSCSGCHGRTREGGIGPALVPGRLVENDAFYFDIIKNGRSGTIMPAWGKLGLRDEEITPF